MEEKQDTILLTGFGPFGEHKVNASWQVVQLVKTMDIEQRLNVRLVIEELPVEYEAVDKLVPALWSQHQPCLVVHVGVSSVSLGLTLECRAHNEGYTRPDVQDKSPCDACCTASNPATHIIDSGLDVKGLCQSVQKAGLSLTTHTSTFAGRYLCEYTYYKSLCVDPERSLFIHVPPLGKGLTTEEMARGVAVVLEEALKQVKCKSKEVVQES